MLRAWPLICLGRHPERTPGIGRQWWQKRLAHYNTRWFLGMQWCQIQGCALTDTYVSGKTTCSPTNGKQYAWCPCQVMVVWMTRGYLHNASVRHLCPHMILRQRSGAKNVTDSCHLKLPSVIASYPPTCLSPQKILTNQKWHFTWKKSVYFLNVPLASSRRDTTVKTSHYQLFSLMGIWKRFTTPTIFFIDFYNKC